MAGCDVTLCGSKWLCDVHGELKDDPPATKSDTATSPNIAPATKNDSHD